MSNMYELPFAKAIQRQARPRVIFGRLNPAHNLGVTRGETAGNLSNKAVGSVGAKMGPKIHFDDGGIVSGVDPNTVNTLATLIATQGVNQSNQNMMGAPVQQQQPQQNQPWVSPASLPLSDDGDTGTGLSGWLNSKHAGTTGRDWLNAGMAGLAGILGGAFGRSGWPTPIKMHHCGGGIVGNNYAGGGQVQGIVSGPGDGVSDSVPVPMSDGGGAAGLSNGEYVLDAHDVSSIGNGSTQAGKQKLDAARMALRKKKFHTAKRPAKVSDGSNPVLKALIK